MTSYTIYLADRLEGAPSEQLRPVGKIKMAANKHEQALDKFLDSQPAESLGRKYKVISDTDVVVGRVRSTPSVTTMKMSEDSEEAEMEQVAGTGPSE